MRLGTCRGLRTLPSLPPLLAVVGAAPSRAAQPPARSLVALRASSTADKPASSSFRRIVESYRVRQPLREVSFGGMDGATAPAEASPPSAPEHHEQKEAGRRRPREEPAGEAGGRVPPVAHATRGVCVCAGPSQPTWPRRRRWQAFALPRSPAHQSSPQATPRPRRSRLAGSRTWGAVRPGGRPSTSSVSRPARLPAPSPSSSSSSRAGRRPRWMTHCYA
jgi:hypothetical protein